MRSELVIILKKVLFNFKHFMRKIFFLFAMLCSLVLQATPLEPQVRLIDATSVCIYWDSYGTYSNHYRVVIAQEELTGNPEYWKGIHYVQDTFYVASNLIEGQLYHVYLQGIEGGDIQDWVTTTFVPRAFSPCQVNIKMTSTGEWGGNGFYIYEGGESHFFAYQWNSSRFTDTTYISLGGPLRIVWHRDESSWWIWWDDHTFTITMDDGTVLVDVDASTFKSLSDEEVLFEGQVCEPACAATISNLAANVNGTDYTVTWDATGADHFEVAVLQKSNPTSEDKEAAAVTTSQTSYSFTGKQYGGYTVFVRAVCADGEKGAWHAIGAYAEVTPSQEFFASVAEPITLTYSHAGDWLEDAVIATESSDVYLMRVLSLNLEDSTDIIINFLSDDIQDLYSAVYQDTAVGKEWKNIYMSDTERTIELPKLKGKFYIVLNTQNETGLYSLLIQAKKSLVPTAMPLDFYVEGDFADSVLWTSPYLESAYAKAYSVTPTDTTYVNLSLGTKDYSSGSSPVRCWVFRNEINPDSIDFPLDVGTGVGATLDKGVTYYIIAGAVLNDGGTPNSSYTLTMYPYYVHGAVTLTPTTITALDFTETTDFTDAQHWEYMGAAGWAKAYRYTPSDTIPVSLSLQSDDAVMIGSGMFGESSIKAYLFENGMGMSDQKTMVMAGESTPQTLYKDSTYYIVLLADSALGGKATDSYTLNLYDLSVPKPVPSTPITPDTFALGTIADYIPALNYTGKVYEYVATENDTLAFSVETFSQEQYASVYVFKDAVSWSNGLGPSASSGDEYYGIVELEGTPAGTHYYFAVMGYQSADFRFMLRRAIKDYDHLPVQGTIAVGEANQSQLSVQNGFTYHNTACNSDWYGPYEAYQVALEKDKEYMIMMHKRNLPAAYANEYTGMSVSVFQPGAQQGSYEGNLKSAECNDYDADWVVLHFASDSTVVDTILLDAYFRSKYEEGILDYEFSVEEVIEFSDLVATAPVVADDALPYALNGVFSGNSKVLPDDPRGFHPVPLLSSSYIQEYGAYDAMAHTVRIAAGDTLFVQFGGDEDAVIQIYDANTLALLSTIDNEHYNFPYESDYIVNDGTDSVDYAVVCSFNKVIIADAAWSLRIAKSKNDTKLIPVTAKVNAESVTIYESDGAAAAQAELAKLIFTVVDDADNVIATLDNNPFCWEIDLTHNTASYELNNSDLPLGYKFEYGSETITVDLDRIPDLPTGFIEGANAEADAKALKVLRDGQILIIRDGKTYSIMGQRVK